MRYLVLKLIIVQYSLICFSIILIAKIFVIAQPLSVFSKIFGAHVVQMLRFENLKDCVVSVVAAVIFQRQKGAIMIGKAENISQLCMLYTDQCIWGNACNIIYAAMK